MGLRPNQVTPTSYGQVAGNKKGTGPKKGQKRRPGPAGKSFSHFMKDLRESGEAQEAIRRALSDENSKGFAAALRILSEYDPEKPAAKKESTGTVSVKVEVAREGKRDVVQVHSQEALSPSTLKAIAEASSAEASKVEGS